jgi:hypothetical protein
MIDIRTLTDADAGRCVVYVPLVGRREQGTVTSWNWHVVFVRYGLGSTSTATDPRDLMWLARVVTP